MRRLSLLTLLPLLTLLAPSAAHAIDVVKLEDGTRFAFSGYAQPYFRIVENPCQQTLNPGTEAAPGKPTCTRSIIPDGFGLQHVRLVFEGENPGRGKLNLEIATAPNVELVEMDLGFELAPHTGLRVGRMKVPYSRGGLVSESRSQFVVRTDQSTLATGRQLGVALKQTLDLGGIAEFASLEVGAFNGDKEAERSTINNIDEEFLYTARLVLQPTGKLKKLYEGDLRPIGERNQLHAALGIGATTETNTQDDYDQVRAGADLNLLYGGMSLLAESLYLERTFFKVEVPVPSRVDYSGLGWAVAAGAFVPGRWTNEHLELAARYEWFDPRAAADPAKAEGVRSQLAGSGYAEPSEQATQARAVMTAGANVYFAGHDFKLQLNYVRRTELEDWSLSAPAEIDPENPTTVIDPRASREVDDDSFVAQLTYRL